MAFIPPPISGGQSKKRIFQCVTNWKFEARNRTQKVQDAFRTKIELSSLSSKFSGKLKPSFRRMDSMDFVGATI